MSTGREALTRALVTHPDLTILDNRLPDISGLQGLHDLCQSDPTARVVITGFGTIEQATQAFKWGAADFICKPILSEKLLQIARGNVSGVPLIQRPIVRYGEPGYLAALPSIGPAAHRWAVIVAPVVMAEEDTPTVHLWSKIAALSEGSIKARCHRDQRWDLLKLLDVGDIKTVKRSGDIDYRASGTPRSPVDDR